MKPNVISEVDNFLNIVKQLKGTFTVEDKPVIFKWVLRDFNDFKNRRLVSNDSVNGLREIGSIKTIEGPLAKMYFERYKRIIDNTTNRELSTEDLDAVFAGGPEVLIKKMIVDFPIRPTGGSVDITRMFADDILAGIYTRYIYYKDTEQLIVLSVWAYEIGGRAKVTYKPEHIPHKAPSDEVKGLFLDPKLHSLVVDNYDDVTIKTEVDKEGFSLSIANEASETLCTVIFNYGYDVTELIESSELDSESSLVSSTTVKEMLKGTPSGFLIENLIPKGIVFGFEYHRNTVTNVTHFNRSGYGARWVLYNRDLNVYLEVLVGKSVC